jgi:hypothetical protein
MALVPVLFNGKSYENADVTLTVMGAIIAGMKGLSFYDGLPDKGGVTGTGSDYVSYVNGKRKKGGSLTLMYEEVVNIQNIAPNGNLALVPLFPITVTLTDATLVTRAYVLLCGFQTFTFDSKDGDTGIPCELPLFVASVQKTA